MYANKAELARIFGVSRPTVCKRIEGIEDEIGKRYNEYAILDGLISVAVFADYEKYRNHLSNRNLRKYVPPFDKEAAEQYISKYQRVREKTGITRTENTNAILIVRVDDKEMKKISKYIEQEIDKR